MERTDRVRTGRQLLTNQPYDESLEAADSEEVVGVYSQRQVKNMRATEKPHSLRRDTYDRPQAVCSSPHWDSKQMERGSAL